MLQISLFLCFLIFPHLDEDKRVISLVKARVNTISEVTDNTSVATLEIIHIYFGDDSLKGKHFRDYQAFGVIGGGHEASARFQENEESIWTVELRESQICLSIDETMPFRIRSRKADNSRHKRNVALAETIEKFGKLKEVERTKALHLLTSESIPELSVWAVRTIGNMKSVDAREILDCFAKNPETKLPIPAQVEFDKILSKLKKEDWQWSNSPLKNLVQASFTIKIPGDFDCVFRRQRVIQQAAKSRSALLRSWVDRKVDEYDAIIILSRLYEADQHDELPNKTAIDLSRIAAENKNWKWPSRKMAILEVGQIASHGVNDEQAYNWLFEQVQKNSDIAVRRTAARAIFAYLTLYPARLKAVEEHLLKETDKEVSKYLQDAVKKEKERNIPKP